MDRSNEWGPNTKDCPECGKPASYHCNCGIPKEVLRLQARKDKRNQARRERHQAMLDLGLVRVRGALGGVYYE